MVPHIKNFTAAEILGLSGFVICLHGFGTGKHGSKIARLMSELSAQNIGAVAIDLPEHGENKNKLTIDNCIKDIAEIENHLRQFNKPISFYGCSFGGYTTLAYLLNNKNIYKNIFLLVPLIDAYKKYLPRLGQVYGKTNIVFTTEFVNSTKKFDVIKNAKNYKNLDIVYAEFDQTVDNNDILNFAKATKSNLYEIKGANHWFENEGELDQVMKIAIEVFTR
ncbi:MAG: alpha/beta hydrolase [Firmicutes bacterium]|nr:alpha/beta hydrolase [Bacillota bacterium]